MSSPKDFSWNFGAQVREKEYKMAGSDESHLRGSTLTSRHFDRLENLQTSCPNKFGHPDSRSLLHKISLRGTTGARETRPRTLILAQNYDPCSLSNLENFHRSISSREIGEKPLDSKASINCVRCSAAW